MKKGVISLFLLALMVLVMAPSQAMAKKALKGTFSVTLQTQLGPITVDVNFKSGQKGVASLGAPINFSYREDEETLAGSIEFTKQTSLTGMASTLILRGVKVTDDSIMGAIFLIPDVPAGTAPPAVAAGTFVGTRKKK
jgi:hypothetical protein